MSFDIIYIKSNPIMVVNKNDHYLQPFGKPIRWKPFRNDLLLTMNLILAADGIVWPLNSLCLSKIAVFSAWFMTDSLASLRTRRWPSRPGSLMVSSPVSSVDAWVVKACRTTTNRTTYCTIAMVFDFDNVRCAPLPLCYNIKQNCFSVTM